MTVLCACVSVYEQAFLCLCELPSCVCKCVCSRVCMQERVRTVWRRWQDRGERHTAASNPGAWWTLGPSQREHVIPQRPCGESKEAGCTQVAPPHRCQNDVEPTPIQMPLMVREGNFLSDSLDLNEPHGKLEVTKLPLIGKCKLLFLPGNRKLKSSVVNFSHRETKSILFLLI